MNRRTRNYYLNLDIAGMNYQDLLDQIEVKKIRIFGISNYDLHNLDGSIQINHTFLKSVTSYLLNDV